MEVKYALHPGSILNIRKNGQQFFDETQLRCAYQLKEGECIVWGVDEKHDHKLFIHIFPDPERKWILPTTYGLPCNEEPPLTEKDMEHFNVACKLGEKPMSEQIDANESLAPKSIASDRPKAKAGRPKKNKSLRINY